MIKAGVSEVNITPPVGISMCGFAGRKGPSESVHDELFARALVLDNGETQVAIVGADVISFAPDLVARIRKLVAEATGILEGHVLLNGSHTHSGPTVMAFRCMGDRDEAYEDVLCRKVVGAIVMAVDNVEPAVLSLGRAPVRIAYNRRELRDGRIVLGHHPNGPEAPWVDVLRVNREDETPLAVVFVTASHPVNLSSLVISAEFPGYAAQFVRENLGGAMPLFLQGCCGDINCSPKDKTFECTQRLGALLGAAAVTAAINAQPIEGGVLAVENRRVELPLMIPDVDVAAKAYEDATVGLERAREDKAITPYQLRQRFEGSVGWAEDYVKASREGGKPTQAFEIQAILIGNMAVVGYPGEMFVDYQLSLEEGSPFDRTFAVAYSNGCIGYVPTADAYPAG
ncbi:MAG: neutral/alkaline non-lysosomal ceramidase N-terminal domain-containing protein, partial [Candidatus Latescibacteria bacterium]|nr:neutral/alkaline non-lysosomal ceramidase N-terminal domain-containing protein [Candidatus Latescibacterota bacterium]